MKEILTQRLLLRNFTQEDYEDVYAFLSQRKFDRFEAYPDITYENGHEHLKYRLNNDEFIAIVLRDSGRVIGNVYFGKREFEGRELGYIVNKDTQRKGYATEAIHAILKDAFANGVHRVYAECDPENVSSWGLLESLHFRKEALLKQNVYFKKDANGEPIWQDTCVYALLKEEYK